MEGRGVAVEIGEHEVEEGLFGEGDGVEAGGGGEVGVAAWADEMCCHLGCMVSCMFCMVMILGAFVGVYDGVTQRPSILLFVP